MVPSKALGRDGVLIRVNVTATLFVDDANLEGRA
jgi:hypothetical protein